MFEKFGEIIFESGSYVVHEKEKGKAYVARHIRSDRRETWSQVEFEVMIRAEDGTVVCECGLGEHMGMPCCHAVKVRFLRRFRLQSEASILILECIGSSFSEIQI